METKELVLSVDFLKKEINQIKNLITNVDAWIIIEKYVVVFIQAVVTNFEVNNIFIWHKLDILIIILLQKF